MNEITCQECDATFLVPPSRARKARYCGTKCRDRARRSIQNEIVFGSPNPLSAYWAGFLMADGNVTSWGKNQSKISLVLGARDLGHLLQFAQFVGYRGDVRFIPSHDTYAISGSSALMADDLSRWGVVPDKTHVGAVPDIPSELVPDYIRGLIDGDGCICIRDDGLRPEEWSVVLVNNARVTGWVADQMERQLQLHPKTAPSQHNDFSGHTTYRLSLYRQAEIQSFLRWVGYESDVVALSRKRDLARSILQKNVKSPLTLTHGSITETVKGWSRITGITENAIRSRIRAGKDTKEILGFSV